VKKEGTSVWVKYGEGSFEEIEFDIAGSVSALKKTIKKEFAPKLDRFAFDDLRLYAVNGTELNSENTVADALA